MNNFKSQISFNFSSLKFWTNTKEPNTEKLPTIAPKALEKQITEPSVAYKKDMQELERRKDALTTYHLCTTGLKGIEQQLKGAMRTFKSLTGTFESLGDRSKAGKGATRTFKSWGGQSKIGINTLPYSNTIQLKERQLAGLENKKRDLQEKKNNAEVALINFMTKAAPAPAPAPKDQQQALITMYADRLTSKKAVSDELARIRSETSLVEQCALEGLTPKEQTYRKLAWLQTQQQYLESKESNTPRAKPSGLQARLQKLVAKSS